MLLVLDVGATLLRVRVDHLVTVAQIVRASTKFMIEERLGGSWEVQLGQVAPHAAQKLALGDRNGFPHWVQGGP